MGKSAGRSQGCAEGIGPTTELGPNPGTRLKDRVMRAGERHRWLGGQQPGCVVPDSRCSRSDCDRHT